MPTAPLVSAAGLPLIPKPVAGRYYELMDLLGNTRASLAACNVLTGGTIYLFPFPVLYTTTVSEIDLNVTTAVGGSNMRLGFYSDANGLPSALIAGSDTGNIATASTGNKTSTPSTAIPLYGGRYYWFALHPSGAIAVNSYSGASVLGLGAAAANDTTIYTCLTVTQAYGALPATISSPALANFPGTSNGPRFQLLLATVG